MEQYGLLEDAKSKFFLEFGSGKGYLTSKMVEYYPEINHIALIDRGKFKMTADRFLRQKSLQRVRCDIADFDPSKLEAPISHPNIKWVCYGKHLCGGATDLTLRCCSKHLISSCENGSGGVYGFALASCCHHLCSWDQYVGKLSLSQFFSPQDFELMALMCSWAMCGHSPCHPSSQDLAPDVPAGATNEGTPAHGKWKPHHTISRARRMAIGAKCKEIIDRGRILWWTEELGHRGEDLVYIDQKASGENRLLLGIIN